MKLNSEDYYKDILTKLFGEDLSDKLMSSEVSDEFVDAVEESIKEIEELTKKDNLKEILNQEKNKEKINSEEMEEEPRKFPDNEIIRPNLKVKYKSYKKNNKVKKNIYQEFDFKKNLRKEQKFGTYTKNRKRSCNNSVKKEKPFVSATSIYGRYFDPPLQKGGISKLDDYKK